MPRMSPDVENKGLRQPKRFRTAQVLLDHSQRHVYARRNSGGGPDPTILFKNCVIADLYLCKFLSELCAVFPMGGRPPAVQMAAMREDKCAKTDRNKTSASPCHFFKK